MSRRSLAQLSASIALAALLAGVSASARAEDRALPGMSAPAAPEAAAPAVTPAAGDAGAVNAIIKGEDVAPAPAAGDAPAIPSAADPAEPVVNAPAPASEKAEATTPPGGAAPAAPATVAAPAEAAAPAAPDIPPVPPKVVKLRDFTGQEVGADSQGNPILAPAEPVARAAFDVLQKHCARCHQDGLLEGRDRPAKNFGNILMLDEVARDAHLVQPGNPDGSRIVQQILNQEMPYDLYYEFATDKPEVGPDDLAALRAWVAGLSGGGAIACTGRSFVSNADVAGIVADDLQKQPSTKIAGTRYLTLAHLHNACATDEEMNAYRQGAVKLLNGLSRATDAVRLAPADPAGTVVRFNLGDLGWSADDWNRIVAAYPYAIRPDAPIFAFVKDTTGSAQPYIRADWFAFSAAQPPLYNSMLGLPGSFAELQRKLGVDVAGDIASLRAARAGFQKSGESRNNRMVERHTIPTGFFWTSYDFAGARDRQSIFEHPLGPGGTDGFVHDGGETLFSLPNGFVASFLADAAGRRLDKAPTSVVQDPTRRDLTVTNGISCMGCHGAGLRAVKDEIRAHVVADRTFEKPVREAVEALHPEAAEMDRILAEDGERFAAAMRRAGLDPTLKLNGVEPVNALATRFERPVEVTLAAAEFGLSTEAFLAALDNAGVEAAPRLKRRFAQGVVPREEFEEIFPTLVARLTDDEPIGAMGAAVTVAKVDPGPVGQRHEFGLSLVADRSSYRVGDLATFTVNSERACFLTLVDVDQTGLATVIFPNRFQVENHIAAGTDFVFPAADAKFQFRFGDPGLETVIAVCSTESRSVDGIVGDYADSAFVSLGNYDDFLKRSLASRGRPAAEPTGMAGADGMSGMAGMSAPADGAPAEPPAAGRAAGEIVARTAIRLEIAP
ncbi:MAG TPA: DUF4384 domain-containing protein [Kaistiaceae bacterium]|nr:DUF4384 domain-containing protein [Kaistiaceae bacterium]